MKFQTIHAAFSELAGRMPGQIALLCEDRRVSYGELAERSDRIAASLRMQGIRRGQRVGLYSQRSVDAIAAILGILKAGAAYVPFDPSYPSKLLRFIYEDCAPSLMLVQPSLVTEDNPAFWDEHRWHDIGTVAEQPLTAPQDSALPDVGPEDAAYIMYTSGSTGHPKGVLIPHRGVVRLVIDNPFADMGPAQVHLQLAPLTFDASTFEIWGALLNGARLAILPAPHPSLDDIGRTISRHGVTTLWLTAGLFHLMVDHQLDALRPLAQLIAGGDVLSPQHVAKAQAGLPTCQLINGYGPTENTTFTCCYRIPRPIAPGPIPIGTAIAHTVVRILDESRSPVTEGQAGELYAGGAGVALGYWNRPELTAERFVDDPFDAVEGGKLYRTGDRVRRRPDGNIEFLGRIDRQVKINGKRVELDEIEACLRRNSLVEDAAVTSPAVDTGTRRIHAFVKFRLTDPAQSSRLRDFLKQELPDYMLPSLTVMDALPLSPTGKVDRSKLPAPQSAGPAAPGPPAADGNPIESQLRAIWRRVLGVESVGADDNFFDLGGTSLQLIQVHAIITATMQSDVTVVDLFQFPRISALAARLSRAAEPQAAQAAPLNADERARRQHAAVARARANPRRHVQ